MTVEPFTIPAFEWFRYSRKSIEITITGTPADVPMRFVMRRQSNAPVLLEKLTTAGDIEVSGEDDELATVLIGGETVQDLLDDYENLPAGYYWAELYDVPRNDIIACGDVTIQPGDAPEEE